MVRVVNRSNTTANRPSIASLATSGMLWTVITVLLAATISTACGRSGEYVVTERPSDGYSVFVVEDEAGVRRLRFEREGIDQSAVVPGDPEDLVFAYMRGLMTAFALVRDPDQVLLVGLGGGTFPMFVRRHLPEAHIDVVEIDPVVLAVAEDHLGFRRDPELIVHLQDGRRFVESGGGDRRWSVIALDAYGPDHIPEHLATRGFYEAVRARLASGGVAVMNLWSEYASARYFDMLRTIEDVFDEVHVVAPARSESRIIIAFKEPVGLSKEDLVARATELKKAWRLRFDLPAMIRRGHAGPTELPQGGRVLEDTGVPVGKGVSGGR